MITIWKEKARTKSISRSDMVAYCILKAMHCKSENKDELLGYFIARAFPPKKNLTPYNGAYMARTLAQAELRRELMYRETILGSKELYEGIDIDQFRTLLARVV